MGGLPPGALVRVVEVHADEHIVVVGHPDGGPRRRVLRIHGPAAIVWTEPARCERCDHPAHELVFDGAWRCQVCMELPYDGPVTMRDLCRATNLVIDAIRDRNRQRHASDMPATCLGLSDGTCCPSFFLAFNARC